MLENPGTSRRRMAVFYAKDAKDLEAEMMPMEGLDENLLARLARLKESGLTDEGLGASSRVLFGKPGEDGMSLVHIWFKSGYVLPFHSHNVDCLYYVTGGELRIGSHVLRKGDGMFIPGDHAYGYEAGPEGVELLEFRNATRFNFVFGANDEGRWNRIAETYRDRAAIWEDETVPPSDR